MTEKRNYQLKSIMITNKKLGLVLVMLKHIIHLCMLRACTALKPSLHKTRKIYAHPHQGVGGGASCWEENMQTVKKRNKNTWSLLGSSFMYLMHHKNEGFKHICFS